MESAICDQDQPDPGLKCSSRLGNQQKAICKEELVDSSHKGPVMQNVFHIHIIMMSSWTPNE